MKLVADANVLFSLAREGSVASAITAKYKILLYSPSYALDEIARHKKEFVANSGLRTFRQAEQRLLKMVRFIKKAELQSELKDAAGLVSDPKDIAYIALAKKIGCPVWSNDKHLKEQTQIPVFTTKELLEVLT